MLHVDLPVESKGGVAFQVERLATALARRGHDIVVFTLSPPSEAQPFAVRQLRGWGVARTRLGRVFVLPLAFAARRYREFDVVHVHGDGQFLAAAVPVVRTFYGSAREESRHARTWARRLSQRVQAVFEVVDRRRAEITVGISVTTAEAIGPLDLVIPCGVDRVRFRPGPKSASPSILFVGTLGGRKRGDFLLEVFGSVVLPRVPEAELWMVTDEEVSGPGVRWFRRPSDDQLAQRFREAWVFTLPSTYEGFGVPYVEAMASGTAVVATENPGAREILDGGVGVLTDDAGLGAELAMLLGDDPRRAAMGQRGRQASERYDWAVVAESYENAYLRARKGSAPR